MEPYEILEVIEKIILVLAAVEVATIVCWILLFLFARIYYYFKDKRR